MVSWVSTLRTLAPACILTLICKNLHTKKCTSIETHISKFDMLCDCEEKKQHVSYTLEIEIRHTTRHVTLRWHCRNKCRCQLTSILAVENIMWHFGFEVEHYMIYVKRTFYFWGVWPHLMCLGWICTRVQHQRHSKMKRFYGSRTKYKKWSCVDVGCQISCIGSLLKRLSSRNF